MSVEMREILANDFPEAVRADFFEIVEPSHHVSTQDQFFNWTQTELQRMFPHRGLACGVGRLCKNGAHLRHFLACNFPQEYIATLQRPDGVTSSPLLLKWMKDRQPVLFELDRPENENSYPAEWLSNFREYGLDNIAAHGVFDIDSQTASYFCFSGIPARLSPRHAYLLKLLIPHMHSALTRVVSGPQFRKRNPPKKQANLTDRETEILQWLSSGKSNWEIAQVVGLSEATVKNHLFHIMRKMQTSTRAQTVAKALSGKLIDLNLTASVCAGTVLVQAQEWLESASVLLA